MIASPGLSRACTPAAVARLLQDTVLGSREATPAAPLPQHLWRALVCRWILLGHNCLYEGWRSPSTRPSTVHHLISSASLSGLEPEPAIPSQAAGQRLRRRVCQTRLGRERNRRMQKYWSSGMRWTSSEQAAAATPPMVVPQSCCVRRALKGAVDFRVAL